MSRVLSIMKNTFFSCFLVLAFFAPSMPILSIAQGEYSAQVSLTQASISFPILNDTSQFSWSWNLSTTPTNRLEYQWSALVKNDTAQYRFGFFLFKRPNSKMSSGDIGTLLQAGQLSVFRVSDLGFSMIRGAKFTTTIEEDRLTISIEDSETISTLFSSRPQNIQFEVRAPHLRPMTEIVNVKYLP
jgi:hypothetical protein